MSKTWVCPVHGVVADELTKTNLVVHRYTLKCYEILRLEEDGRTVAKSPEPTQSLNRTETKE